MYYKFNFWSNCIRRGDSKSQDLIYNSKVGFPSLKVLSINHLNIGNNANHAPKQSDGVKCRPGRVTLQQRPTPLNYQSSSLASVHPQLNLGHVQVPTVNKDIAQDAHETDKRNPGPNKETLNGWTTMKENTHKKKI